MVVVGMSVIQLSTRPLETLRYAHSVTQKRKMGQLTKIHWKIRIHYAHFQSTVFLQQGMLHLFQQMILIQHIAAALWQWGLLNANTQVCITQLWNPTLFIASSTTPMVRDPLNGTVLLSVSSVPKRSRDLIHLTTSKVIFQQFASCHKCYHLFQHREKPIQLSWQQTLHTPRQVIWEMTCHLNEKGDFWSSGLALR